MTAFTQRRRPRPFAAGTRYRGKRRRLPSWEIWLLTGAGLLALTGLLLLLCRTAAGDAIRAAGVRINAALAWLFSFTRWPVTEGLLVLAPVLLIVLLVRALRRGRRRVGLFFSRLFCLLCAMILMFVGCYGVQYTRPALGDALGLETVTPTEALLADTLSQLTDLLNDLAPRVPRGADGGCDFEAFDTLSRRVMAAYDRLDDTVPALAAVSRVPPKQARLISLPMSYLSLAGFFCPWTGECVVSGDTLDVQRPFFIAHESAHARGVGSENEANFAAFLACMASDDQSVRYSAVYSAWVYVYNAYFRVNPEAARAVRAGICPQAETDLTQVNEHLRRYDTVLYTIGNAVNDAYIKTTGQSGGVQSYGAVTDLLIAYFHSELYIH